MLGCLDICQAFLSMIYFGQVICATKEVSPNRSTLHTQNQIKVRKFTPGCSLVEPRPSVLGFGMEV